MVLVLVVCCVLLVSLMSLFRFVLCSLLVCVRVCLWCDCLVWVTCVYVCICSWVRILLVMRLIVLVC